MTDDTADRNRDANARAVPVEKKDSAGQLGLDKPESTRYKAASFAAPRLSRRTRTDGRIAQLVEQLTLNQRVQGSSPCAPTIRTQ